MELSPHPMGKNKAVVTLENRQEDIAVNHRLPFFSLQDFRHSLLLLKESLRMAKLGELGPAPREYPRNIILTKRDLGHVASKSLMVNDFELTRQITDYLESEAIDKTAAAEQPQI